MSKLQKIMFVFFLLLLGLLVYVEATKPQPVNWYPSYNKLDKIPLGTFVIHDLLQQHFTKNFIEVNNPPYNHLQSNDVDGTYLFVNNQLTFDEVELESLLSWTAKGNTLFLSANNYSRNLLDTLGLEVVYFFNYNRLETQPVLNLVNKNLKSPTPHHIKRNFDISYFERIDTLNTIVLGVSQSYQGSPEMDTPKANFIKMPFQDGNIYLYNQPEIFTNFFLLNDENFSFTPKVLSYLNSNTTLYWDNYHKTGKRTNASPLQLIFNTKSLKWAYYTLLLGVFIFVIFNGKRTQRSIPALKPLTNKTFEYTQTISGIYLENNDNKGITIKIIKQFLEFVRIKLRLETHAIDLRFQKDFARRTDQTEAEVKTFFETIKQIQSQQTVTDTELKELHKKISEFKTKIDGKH